MILHLPTHKIDPMVIGNVSRSRSRMRSLNLFQERMSLIKPQMVPLQRSLPRIIPRELSFCTFLSVTANAGLRQHLPKDRLKDLHLGFSLRKFTALSHVSRDNQSDLPSLKSSFIKVTEEVKEALATGKPVVALETAIYTHGLSL